MKITIALTNHEAHYAYGAYFRDDPNINLQIGDILEMEGDTLIAPTNSFGWMTSGTAQHYAKKLGQKLQTEAHQAIQAQPFAELLIGQALTIPIRNQPQLKHLILTPTMRVPSTINHTVNIYLAFRAALHQAKLHNTHHLLTPALGTGTGKVPYATAAAQMKTALRHYNQPPHWPPPPLQHHQLQHQALADGKTGNPN